MSSDKIILDGKILAQKIKDELKEIVLLNNLQNLTLATILVGADLASQTYVKMKIKACELIGIKSKLISLDDSTDTATLIIKISELNQDKNITGILLQHPVPKHIDERKAFESIAINKDVDGVTCLGFGQMSMELESFVSCTPLGIIKLLKHYKVPLVGKHVVVVGRSAILGKPLAMLLLRENATVTICHSYTKNLPQILSTADVVVGACGKANLINGEWLSDGVVVVDAGYNKGNVGDCDYESCFKKASFITPVPGGVGPMTIAMLLENTVKAGLKKS